MTDTGKLAEQEKIAAELVANAEKRREEHDRAVKALDGLPYVAVPTDQLVDIYERMLRLIQLGQFTIEEAKEYDSLPEPVRALRRAVFAQADFGAVHTGQWLPKDIRKAVYAKVKGEQRPIVGLPDPDATGDKGK